MNTSAFRFFAGALVPTIVMLLNSCSPIPSTKEWHPKKPVMRYNGEPWGVRYFPPPQIELSIVKKIKIGDSEDTIRAITGEYPASWMTTGSALLTEIDGKKYEVVYLYRDRTGYIKDISYKKLENDSITSGELSTEPQPRS